MLSILDASAFLPVRVYHWRLQSAKAFFIARRESLLFQSATASLLESVKSVITKCDRRYKV